MTVSKSCPPGPTSRTARSPRRGRALPPLQSLGGSLHYRGSNGGRVCTGIRAGSADSSCPGLALPNPGRAGGVLAAAAFRHSCSFRGSGWCACLRVCVCARVCAPTRMCPLHMHVPTYWPRRRWEPWLPRMRRLTINTRTVAPQLCRQQAEWLLKGRKQGSLSVSC